MPLMMLENNNNNHKVNNNSNNKGMRFSIGSFLVELEVIYLFIIYWISIYVEALHNIWQLI